jgi:hypothetical protein
MTGQAFIIIKEYIRPAFSPSSHFPFLAYHDPTALHKNFAIFIRPGDIVLSDVPTSWAVPLYTGAKIVSLFHTPTHVKDNDARKNDITLFYDPALGSPERLDMLRKYGITKILLHFTVSGAQIVNQIREMGFPCVADNDVFCIFDTAAAHTPEIPLKAPAGPTSPATLRQ